VTIVNRFVYFTDIQIAQVEAIAEQAGLRFREVVSLAVDEYIAQANSEVTDFASNPDAGTHD
jgi:hypothetical protein